MMMMMIMMSDDDDDDDDDDWLCFNVCIEIGLQISTFIRKTFSKFLLSLYSTFQSMHLHPEENLVIYRSVVMAEIRFTLSCNSNLLYF